MADLQALRNGYRADKTQLLQTWAKAMPPAAMCARPWAAWPILADGVLKQLWDHAGLQHPFALLAVGGFGRGELFPHSDVDVLVLLPDEYDPHYDTALKGRIEAFIGSCWDVGLEIGSSVRTLSTCLAEAAKDVTIQTALLECRLVTGNADLVAQFKAAFFKAMDPKAFFVAKTLELRQRHTKFENTPYALEPNCKESPGGLRDLQVILWVAKAAGFGDDWHALAVNGLATPFEVKQIQRNESLLMRVRARLHLIAGRREDRLIFGHAERDRRIVRLSHVAPTHSASASSQPPTPAKGAVRASEALMKALLLGGQGRGPAEPDLAAQYRRTAQPVHPRPPSHQRPFQREGGHDRRGQ